MNLYNKHRPDSFSKVIGNAATVKALKSTLEKEDLPHAFMISGPSGCGKTTIGRIIKSNLGVGDADYIELDSADFRGIDSVRNIRRNAQLSPIVGKRRLWLIDECHQLTKDAQTALLKILEDPPSHAFFVLATTDPQKLLPTIKNRCTQVVVKPLTDEQMSTLLNKVCRREKKTVPEKVLEQIVNDACGSARAALVVLESIIDLDEESMLESAKQKIIEENEAIELCRAFFEKQPSWSKIGKILSNLEGDVEGTRRMIMSYCNSVLTKRFDERAVILMDNFESNTYDNGKPGLTLLCARAFSDIN